jgi:hypothetical protein
VQAFSIQDYLKNIQNYTRDSVANGRIAFPVQIRKEHPCLSAPENANRDDIAFCLVHARHYHHLHGKVEGSPRDKTVSQAWDDGIAAPAAFD